MVRGKDQARSARLHSLAVVGHLAPDDLSVVALKDPRVQAAHEWIRKHYTLEENPELGRQGLYYYYHTMAKALAAYGEDTVVDARGVKHNWRKDMIEKLLSAQKEDGSWMNTDDRWWEKDPVLVTAYAVLTLEVALRE